jgi:transketolase
MANAVGLAIAEAHLSARFNRPGHTIIDHHTYVLASDGDLMEGVSAEAASLAGHLGLGKLIVLYDANDVCLAGATRLTFTESVRQRFAAYGWGVDSVDDGNDLEALDAAIAAARRERNRPSLVLVQTTIGYGAPTKQGTSAAHGAPLGAGEVAAAKAGLGWPAEPTFWVPPRRAPSSERRIVRGASSKRSGSAEWARIVSRTRTRRASSTAVSVASSRQGGPRRYRTSTSPTRGFRRAKPPRWCSKRSAR